MQSILTTPLKKHVWNRVMLDIIQETKDAVGDEMIFILVLDDYTAKMINTFLSMTDLLNAGIFTVEKLEKVRERFPMYHGIYFISPCEESLSILCKNFEDPLKPQYGRAHLFFTQRITNRTLDKLCINETFIKRVLTLKEVNISFLIRDNNLFDLGMSTALEIFTVKYNNDLKNKIITNILDRLFTVVASLKEKPYVQFQKSSNICEQIAQKIYGQIGEFYEKRTFNEKRGIILILDRTVDVSAPLLHDHAYQCIIHEIMDVRDNVLHYNSKDHHFGETDHIWKKYKTRHFAEVLVEVSSEFKVFMNNDISKVQRGSVSLDNVEKMAGVMQNMKSYQIESNNFGTHLRMIEKLTTVNIFFNYKKDYKDLHIDKIFELEQEIVSGVNNQGEKLSPKELIDHFSKMADLKEEEKIRLLVLIHANLSLNEKDFKTLCGGIEDYKLSAIYKLGWLGNANFE